MSRPKAFKPIAPEPGRLTYQAVRDAVRASVDGGGFAPGEQLPATKSLAEQMGVSLVTVHRALQELVAAGVLRRGQGRGTFVHEDYLERSEVSVGFRFGLVFHAECSLADTYHGQVLEGVRRGAADCGADLVILQFGEDWRNECHGFLYVNPFADQLDRPPRVAIKRPTAESSLKQPPIVVVGANWQRTNVWCVDTDNIDLARQAVDHLVSLGHTRLGYIGGGDQSSNSLDREHGFKAAAAARGLTVDPSHIQRASGWKLDENDVINLKRMLVASDRPTAIFAGGFSLATAVCHAARQLDLRVPEDLSVVGVDDARSGGLTTPPMTALRQPLMAMGRQACRMLLEIIRDRNVTVPTRQLLPAELICRASATRPGESSLFQATDLRDDGVK
jgi:DNA-binding LacI/PurR family transcriptional regulator